MDQPITGGQFSFDMLAASIRADSSDLRTFLDVLATKLEGSLPGHVKVEREGGLLHKSERVRRLTVELGDRVYQMEWAQQSLHPAVGPRGQAVSAVSLDDWVGALWQDLREYSRANAQGKTALDQILSGSAPPKSLSRPAEAASRIYWRPPETEIPEGSSIEVGADEAAVFARRGQVLGTLGPGSWTADVLNTPFLEDQRDQESGSYLADLLFVSTHDFPNLPFGGMVDNVTDPESGLAVGLRVFGDYALRVSDPAVFATKLAGELSSNEEITHWMREHLLRVFRTEVVGLIEGGNLPILGIAAHTGDVEKRTLDSLRDLIGGYGMDIVEMANFTISMKDEDEATLKSFRLENQRRGADPAAKKPAATKAAPATRTGVKAARSQKCPECGTANPASAHFCLNCGHSIATTVTCPDCGVENPAAARFCTGCGRALGAAEGARS
jgi:membrane protease subunit (stomatin/prohibitin family)